MPWTLFGFRVCVCILLFLCPLFFYRRRQNATATASFSAFDRHFPDSESPLLFPGTKRRIRSNLENLPLTGPRPLTLYLPVDIPGSNDGVHGQVLPQGNVKMYSLLKRAPINVHSFFPSGTTLSPTFPRVSRISVTEQTFSTSVWLLKTT